MKAIVIYSGGLDSTVLLYQLLAEGHQVKALSIDYGQRSMGVNWMRRKRYARFSVWDIVWSIYAGLRLCLGKAV